MGRQRDNDRFPRRRYGKSCGGGGLSRRSSEETRGKGGESDATELLLLEFFLGRLREGSGWHLQSNAFSTPFSCSVFLLLNLCLLFLAVAYSSQYEMAR